MVGVEVKAAAIPESKDVGGLQALASAVGKNQVCGFVLYTEGGFIPFSANLHSLPISRLWSA